MADIIQFATGQELQAILEASNQMVSGMTPEEARVALKLVENGKLMTGGATTGGSNNVIQFPGTDASGAFNDYVSSGGSTSITNSATASSTSSATIAQGVTGAGTTTVLGVLTMNLPTVAAAIAPVLGVGVGVGLYELNPDLWEKISRKLLPFCWENTEVAPAVIDESGQVYLPKEMFDAFQEVLQEEGVGAESITGPGDEALDVKGPLNCATIGVGTVLRENAIVTSLSASSPVFGTYYEKYNAPNNWTWEIASPSIFSI